MNIVDTLTNCIQNHQPVVFAKFGDGEYYCVIGYEGANCDNDPYTPKKKEGLIESFRYLVENTEHSYIGMWHSSTEQNQFWKSLVSNPDRIKWAQYHTLIIDENDLDTNEFQKKVQLYKSIQQSPLKKIVVCNELLIKTQLLLNADHIVLVSLNNWFDTQFDSIIQQIKTLIGTDEQFILTTSAGMGAKVLISELCKIYPKGIYLDIGSALDILCTKKDSRGYRRNPDYHYERFRREFSSILPENWDDEKYNAIYQEAQHKLGIHIR